MHICQDAEYVCMFMCEFDAAVAMCVLDECSLLQQSCPAVWVDRPDAL